MRAIVGVLAGACCAAVIACASGRSPRQAAVAPMPGPASGGRGEIAQLDDEIATARARLGLAAPMPSGHTPMAVAPTSGADPTCHPAKTDACSDTCALADSICSDAARICELAKQLPGDAWADGKCTAGEQSCEAAHGRCCGCQ